MGRGACSAERSFGDEVRLDPNSETWFPASRENISVITRAVDLAGVIVAEGLVAAAAVEGARLESVQASRPLAEVLVDRGLVNEGVLADALARAAGRTVVDLAGGSLDAEVVHLVPEELARRYLAVPVAPDRLTASLRVAFVDPFDTAAIAAVQEVTGLDVDVLVTTVSALRALLDRQYGRPERSSRFLIPVDKEDDLAPETTRRTDVEPRVERGYATAPAYRLQDEATPEQRHEALLLALIEAGALSRADYLAVLRRLIEPR